MSARSLVVVETLARDEIRLTGDRGIVLEDTKDGVRWKRKQRAENDETRLETSVSSCDVARRRLRTLCELMRRS